MDITVVRRLVTESGLSASHEVMFKSGDFRTRPLLINPSELRRVHEIAHIHFQRQGNKARLEEKVLELVHQLRMKNIEPTDMVINELDGRDLLMDHPIDPRQKVTYYGLNVIQAIYGIERGTVKVF